MNAKSYHLLTCGRSHITPTTQPPPRDPPRLPAFLFSPVSIQPPLLLPAACLPASPVCINHSITPKHQIRRACVVTPEVKDKFLEEAHFLQLAAEKGEHASMMFRGMVRGWLFVAAVFLVCSDACGHMYLCLSFIQPLIFTTIHQQSPPTQWGVAEGRPMLLWDDVSGFQPGA